ncbi:putative nuclease HARBI1 isoform X2 [Tanacetum coccineum]
MSQINFECLFFDDTDDETEVNSLLSGFLIDVTLDHSCIYSYNPKLQTEAICHKEMFGANDHLSANCPYFQEGCDAVGKAGISALVKCTSAIRQLAYAVVPDSLDEYLQISEKTSRDCLMHFCNGVIVNMTRRSNDVKRIRYKQAHEAARKDVERAFGVLKKKWAIVRTHARSKSLKRITHLMYHMQSYDIYGFEEKERQSLRFYPEEQHHEMIP